MFGDVNVKVEDGNLGRSSSTGTGTSIKIGISNVESKHNERQENQGEGWQHTSC